ncbi:MAG: ROK family protein [Verrucomicrobiota bacterium]
MKVVPPLSPGFVPAVLWNRAYRERVSAAAGARDIGLALLRPGGGASVWRGRVLPAGDAEAELTLRYVERTLKFLLWQRGGCRVLVAGAPEVAAHLRAVYSPSGPRAFDHEFIGVKIHRAEFTVEACAWAEFPADDSADLSVGRHVDGCRIGFDLGGSERKVTALIDGQVVYSDQFTWCPYFQQDPAYHVDGVHEALARAAAHLPRVDAIGGSAAGVYVDNEVRVGSLFRGVAAEDFEQKIRPMFATLRERWGGVPFEVANDGEAAALAGSMALGDNAVLGISMGTSMAGGYVTPGGGITPWLNELAFAPVDYAEDAPADEWSGDIGCGVQYFSTQAVARLALAAGFQFPDGMPTARRVLAVQSCMATGDDRAAAVYATIGVMLGYAVAHYADFYQIRHVLLYGGALAGAGGRLVLDRARETLALEFGDEFAGLTISMPGDADRRHGQAVAAASLPRLRADCAFSPTRS